MQEIIGEASAGLEDRRSESTSEAEFGPGRVLCIGTSQDWLEDPRWFDGAGIWQNRETLLTHDLLEEPDRSLRQKVSRAHLCVVGADPTRIGSTVLEQTAGLPATVVRPYEPATDRGTKVSSLEICVTPPQRPSPRDDTHTTTAAHYTRGLRGITNAHMSLSRTIETAI